MVDGMKMGIAIGATPIERFEDKVRLAVHCKTSFAPQAVVLGRAADNTGNVIGTSMSPLELKRQENGSLLPEHDYDGLARSLVLSDHQYGELLNTPYRKAKAKGQIVVLGYNSDSFGSRVECLLPLPHKGLLSTTFRSRFDDGGVAVVEASRRGAVVVRTIFLNGEKHVLNDDISELVFSKTPPKDDSEERESEILISRDWQGFELSLTFPSKKLLQWAVESQQEHGENQ